MAEAETAAPVEPAAPHLEAGTEPAPAASPEPAAAPEIPAREPSLLETTLAEPVAPAEGETKPDGEPKPKGEAEPAKKDEPAAEQPKPEGTEESKPDGEAAAAAEPAEPVDPAPPEPIAYEPFKFPEGIQIDDKKLEGFRNIASEIRIPQDKAQALVDLYGTAVKEFHDNALAEQHRVFNETRKNWRTEVMADPEIGGSGFQTAMSSIAKLRDRFVPEGERQAFNDFCTLTGAGDHPTFLRMLHRAAKALAEPALPPPNPKPAPNPIARDRRATLYDNPRSPGN